MDKMDNSSESEDVREDDEKPIKLFNESLFNLKSHMEKYEESAEMADLQLVSKIIPSLEEDEIKQDLMPTLMEYAETTLERNPEIQLNFINEMRRYVPTLLVHKNITSLFDVFRLMVSVNESLVRETAVQIILDFMEHFDDETVEETLYSFIMELAENDWFAPKCSAASLFMPCYQRISQEKKTKLFDKFVSMCMEDDPMTKQYYSKALVNFIPILEKDIVLSKIMKIFDFWKNECLDSWKIHAIEQIVPLATIFNEEEISELLLEPLQKFCNDASWKVRLEMAKKLSEIQTAIGFKHSLLNELRELCADREQYVRAEMVKQILKYAEALQKIQTDEDTHQILQNDILLTIKKVSKDDDVVKIALVENLMGMFRILKPEDCKNYLLPIVLSIYSSKTAASNSLKSNFITCLPNMLQVVDFEELKQFTEDLIFEVTSIATDTNWRSRQNLIFTLITLSKYYNEDDFCKKMIPYYLKLLSDKIASIRHTAPIILPILISTFGMTWCKKHIFNKLFYMQNHASYLFRVVVLYCIDETVEPTVTTKLNLNTLDNKSLYEINHLNNLLEKEIKDIKLNSKNNYDFTSHLKFYADETLQKLKNEEIDFIKGDEKYLNSLLLMLLKYVLCIVNKMNKDPINNIKDRVAQTVGKINKLSKCIKDQLEADWAKEILDKLDESERKIIEDEIQEKLTATEEYMDEPMQLYDPGSKFLPNTYQRAQSYNSDSDESVDDADDDRSSTFLPSTYQRPQSYNSGSDESVDDFTFIDQLSENETMTLSMSDIDDPTFLDTGSDIDEEQKESPWNPMISNTVY